MTFPFPVPPPVAGIVTDGLALHLDAGDAASYGGSGQTVTDLSGAGNDFYLGSTSGVESVDPAFNGVAGAKSGSEYFSTDGGDHMDLAAAHSGEFIREVGRSDTPTTIELWVYMATSSSEQMLFSNSYSASGPATTGIQFYWLSGDGLRMSTVGSSTSNTQDTSGTFSLAAWHQIAWAGQLDGATTCRFLVDGVTDSTYTKAGLFTAGDSTYVPRLMRRQGSPFYGMESGGRLAIARIYSRVLSEAELQRNFNAQKSRFGL